ncbi:hypothetical protein PQ465_08545 [Sphingobacterium oryzagri]|uniref:DUF4760 domain-containing protein n=1 Tax=Sphingobacterium oryzagri TaxID=3025669 RepID=A0ABY7WLD3_9SPHI|nr:hypothetical protein [Sphingobacterium sp. KACC 22765]WDF70411.1 hypothetical protein PQ465_08545 [Sphingobacterium sp. KACC 22765]
MEEKKRSSHRLTSKDYLILVGILIGVTVVYFGIYFLLIKGEANEYDKTLYDTSTGLINIVIGAFTIFFVLRTYQSQREQIIKQEIQIDEQREQLKKNDRDVEFNRLVDIFYRQIDFLLPNIHTELYKALTLRLLHYDYSDADKKSFINQEKSKILSYYTILKEQLEIFKTLLNTSELPILEREYIKMILVFNIGTEFFVLMREIKRLSSILDDIEPSIEAVRNPLN